MAYIRNRDIKKVGKSKIEKGRGVLLSKIKFGQNKIVGRKVPTFNYRGKIISKPKKR